MRKCVVAHFLLQLSDEERAKGLITASAGNHAQGVAYAAKCYGCKAVIVMPTTTPLIKVNRTKSYGAEVVLYGGGGTSGTGRLHIFTGTEVLDRGTGMVGGVVEPVCQRQLLRQFRMRSVLYGKYLLHAYGVYLFSVGYV